MKFRPLHDRVVIERIEAEAKTAGGIIIPDTAQEKPQQGKVTAVGPGGPRRERQAHPDRRQGRRPHPVRQMVGHRGQNRWCRVPHNEGERHYGGAGRGRGQEEGGLITFCKFLS